MRKKLIGTVILLVPILMFSQKEKTFDHCSQFRIEALGPGGLLSFHFDSRFRKTSNGPGYIVGLGYAPYGLFEESCNTGGVVTIPAGINYLFGRNHYFEIGAGGGLKFGGGTKVYCPELDDSFFEPDEMFYLYTLLGYRYQPMSKRITISFFISPLFQKGIPAKFWGGAGLGLRFRN